ncbi:hypothetical protein DFQ30_009258 [Apophysomyces sp. BC1015]|nr:hypothetical protein DFQ30_009258 [Apophysomyces sp. BC1015]
MPPELRIELREVKPEQRAPGRTASSVMAAERARIETALPKGARIVALDEHGYRAGSRTVPDAAPCDGARAARRAALPSVEHHAKSSLPSGITVPLDASAHLPKTARVSAPALPVQVIMSIASSLAPSSPTTSTRPAARAIDTAPHHSFIYLASESPRRQALLAQIGVRFKLLLAEAHENAEALEAEQPGESPQDYVVRVSLSKATAASTRRDRLLSRERDAKPAPILVADTTVALDDVILGKPRDTDHALQTLKRLVAREHRVLTAVALVNSDASVTRALSVSRVRFSAAENAALERYVRSGEPLGKAGAYAIQGRAAEFVEHIDGSYSGIMGLPLFETAALLRAARVAFQ